MNASFATPANAGILGYLKLKANSPGAVSAARSIESCSPESVEDAYYSLGTHPDLLSWFWDELTTKLPDSCQWVVHGSPVLAHPESGIIFGFAGGTHTYALRLPPATRDAALKAGCKRIWNYPALPELGIAASLLKLDEIGEEWVFGEWHETEKEWCLAAYEFAALPQQR